MSKKTIIFASLILSILALTYYLFRPLSNIPPPAEFDCIEISEGSFISMDSLPLPQHIYGMGLTYRDHLVETASEYDPDILPPIFLKKLHTITEDGSDVKYPGRIDIIQAAAELEKEVAEKLEAEYEDLSPLLDYEVELGMVLLDSVLPGELEDEDFVPPLGFFIANDLSARSVLILGEGSPLRYDYWGAAKSFQGFLPLSESVWIPNDPKSNSIPCIIIETFVNGEKRQSENTDNMIYTPSEMLRFIHSKYPDHPIKKGDMILTGTAGGVAIATPRALVRLSHLLRFDRYQKLSAKLSSDQSRFLKPGDKVEIRGEGFYPVTVEITEGKNQ
ncbi:MAG: fumarylacetoacetate hydrolase family protein [Saprospiraceae bacterium]|nr:fumarylacetoacetate hydrolase family protein [Saprospiraceae bacterium]